MRLHPIARLNRALQRFHNRHGRHNLVFSIVSQHLEHSNVIRLSPRFLQYATRMANDDGIRGNYYSRFAVNGIVDFSAVDFLRFGRGGFENVV
jgi:hypothetical protein